MSGMFGLVPKEGQEKDLIALFELTEPMSGFDFLYYGINELNYWFYALTNILSFFYVVTIKTLSLEYLFYLFPYLVLCFISLLTETQILRI